MDEIQRRIATDEWHKHERDKRMVQEGLQWCQLRKDESLRQKRQEQYENKIMLENYNPWGRPGGGAPNEIDVRRRKTNIHYQDKKYQGWTGEPAFRRLEQEHYAQEQRYNVPRSSHEFSALEAPQMSNRKEIHPPEELLTGGVELVPLLARRRTLPRRCTLRTTDVTNQKLQEQQHSQSTQQQERSPLWNETMHEKDYLTELTNQVRHKQMKIKEDRNEDLVKSRKHFETWGQFWGRPGHGAPTGRNVKENLDYILYQVPVK